MQRVAIWGIELKLKAFSGAGGEHRNFFRRACLPDTPHASAVFVLEAYTFAMTERSIELLQQALSLTEEERADLAASLLNSLETASDPDAEALWQEEISRRATSLDSGQSRTVPWREVQSQVSAALQHGPKKR